MTHVSLSDEANAIGVELRQDDYTKSKFFMMAMVASRSSGKSHVRHG